MRDYELSLWTHKDLFVGLLRGDLDFEGQAYEVQFKKNVNGEETLSFSIPAVVFNRETGEFEDNHLWDYILNDHKIRLIKDKNKVGLNGESLTTIHDFVIKLYSTERDGVAKIINVECKSYAIYEIGKLGYSVSFDETDLEEFGRFDKSNLDFWTKKLLIYTRNFHSDNVDIFDQTKIYPVRSLARDNSTSSVYLCLKEATNIPFTNASYWKLYQEGANESGWQFEVRAKDGGNTLYEPTTYIGYQSAPNFPTGQPYSIDEVAYDSVTNKSYGSLIESNAQPLTNESAWEFLSYGRGYTPVESVQIEKQRIIDIEKSNIFNITQELSEKFSVWPQFVYGYINGVVTSRKIVFVEEIEVDAKYSISYGINLTNIKKESDSDELVTKIIVEPIENSLEYGGAMSLSDAPQNLMMEDFLYNFDYYNECGYISDDDLRYVKNELPFKIRDCNLQMIEASSLKLPYETQANEVQAQIEFYNAAISAKQQLKDKYTLLIASATAFTTITNTSFTVTTINNGSTQYVDLTSRKGVIDDAGFKVYNSTGSVQITNYSKIYDPDCPEFIKAIKFKDSTVNRARLSFYYNPTAYYTNASAFLNSSIGNYSTFVSSLNATNASLYGSINYYEDIINKKLIDKQILIDDFEHAHHYLIKEGNWKDSDYRIRRDFFSPDLGTFNIATTYETFAEKTLPNAELNGAFYISNNSIALHEINFSTIRIFKTTNDATPTNAAASILLEYKVGSDFTLEYGKYSTDEKSLLVVPMDYSSFSLDLIPTTNHSSKFVDTTNVLMEYYDINGIFKTAALPKATGANVATATRKYRLDFANILESTVEVVCKFGEDPLTLNTDYSLIVNYDSSNQKYYTDLVLKPTREAKFIDQYYNLELYRNITSTFYYNDAIDVAERSSKPNASYTIGAVDLSPINDDVQGDYSEFIPNVGQKILINDKELRFENEYGFLSEVSYDLDNPENNSLTVSNYKSRFEDLFQRIAAATQQMTFKEDTLSRVYETLPQSGIVDPITLQRSFDQNKFVLANSTKNEVVWGTEGITLTDVSGSPSIPGQVKLVGNGIFLSNTIDSSGERIWRTGITGDGINASEMTTGSLNTNKITIFDENSPRFIWNAEGLYAYGELTNGATNYSQYIRFNSDGLVSYNGDIQTFNIDKGGNASFKGTIIIPNTNTSFPFSNYFEVSPTGRTTINNVGVVNNGLVILGGSSLSGKWGGTISGNKMTNIYTGAFGTLSDMTLSVEGKAYFDDKAYFDSYIEVDNGIHLNGNAEEFIIFDDSIGYIRCDQYLTRSDRNLKQNINLFDYDYAYNELKNMKIYSYNYKDRANGKSHLGSMIQEMPIDLLSESNEKAFSLSASIFFHMAATKKLQEKIEELEARITALGG